MTIEEYKKKFISIVKEIEEEHGCDVRGVEVGVDLLGGDTGYKHYKVKIMM